ncbi:MAG: hypothetical protein AAFQ29_08365 [Pseudomonadota bacterium]
MNSTPQWIAMVIVATGLAVTVAARAEGLSSKDALAFAKCMPSFQAAGEALDKAGKLDTINGQTQGMPVVDGQLKMFSVPMARMKTVLPDAYKQFNGLAKDCGMGSVTNFATVGDKVFAAYMASKLPPEISSQMAGLTPEMMAMMPPAAREAMKMMEAMENVPAADKAALTPETVKLLDEVTGFDGALEQAPSLFGK